MARSDETLRWQILLDDDGWESRTESAALIDPDAAAGTTTQRSSRLDRLWVIGFAACLLAGVASLFWLWRDAQAGLELVRNELNGAIELEIWAAERDDPGMMAALLDESTNPTWRNRQLTRFFPPTESSPHEITIRIEEFDLNESRALVDVLVSDSRLPAPYQETRVYRETNTGWIRTAPSVVFWGAWESQESTYFSFRYRKRDAGAVIAAAPQIDRLYEQIYRAVGLPIDPEGEKKQVEVRISGGVTRGSTRNASGRILAVQSPHLLPRPLGVSVETILTESVILQLINLVIWDRMEQMPGDWQSIRSGLRLWLIWKTDGLLAQSKTEIVRWLYEETLNNRGRGDTRRPGNYAEVCQSFWLWQVRPYEIGIPLTCDPTEGIVFTPVRMPIELRQLPMPEMSPEFRGGWTRLNTGRATAVATVFAFLEETYGPAAVPEVLVQTRDHLRWHRVITAAIGIDPDEFETGWLAYLAGIALGNR